MQFKYQLKRMNVVKVTNEEEIKDKLIAQGFELIEKKEDKVEGKKKADKAEEKKKDEKVEK